MKTDDAHGVEYGDTEDGLKSLVEDTFRTKLCLAACISNHIDNHSRGCGVSSIRTRKFNVLLMLSFSYLTVSPYHTQFGILPCIVRGPRQLCLGKATDPKLVIAVAAYSSFL